MADNISINQGTETTVATDDVSNVQFQKIKVNLGADGVDGDTWGGKVAVTAGTTLVTSGTVDNIGTVVGMGTINHIAQIHNSGTVAELPDLPGGTIDTVTDCTVTGGSIVITEGTITSHIDDLDGGTLDLLTAGTITRLEQGSVTVTSGTIAAGSITIIAGTMADVTVTSLSDLPGGTLDEVSVVTACTTVSEVTNLNAGTITSIEGGTIAEITNVAAIAAINGGTIDKLSSGTIDKVTDAVVSALPDLPGGTIDTITNVDGGTVQVHQKPPNDILFITQTGTEAIGTLIAAPGADTSIYLNELSISAHEDDIDIQIAFGTAQTGDGVVTRVFTKAGNQIYKLQLLD